MANQPPQPEESWLIVRLFKMLYQFPFVAISVWFAYRDIKADEAKALNDAKLEIKEAKQERKDSIRDVFDKEQLIYYRDIKLDEMDIRKKELNKRYEKDSIKTK